MATATKTPEGIEPPEAPADPADTPITAEIWALGDHLKQVQVAGLVASKAELHNAKLTPDEWAQHVDDYMRTPRV